MKRTLVRHVVALLFGALMLPGCSDDGSNAGKDSPPPPPPAKDLAVAPPPNDELESAPIGDMTSLHRFGDIYLGGQPSQADLDALKQSGVMHVTSLRLPEEAPEFDEMAAVQAMGMEFYNPGFGKPEDLNDPVFIRVRDLLSNPKNRPMLLHCASGSRVGAIWLAHRVLDHRVDYQQALAEARAIGLKSPGYEAKAKAYIDANRVP